MAHSGLQFSLEKLWNNFKKTAPICRYLHKALLSREALNSRSRSILHTLASWTLCSSHSGKYLYICLCTLLLNQLWLASTSRAEHGWPEPSIGNGMANHGIFSHLHSSVFSLWPQWLGSSTLRGFYSSVPLIALLPVILNYCGALSQLTCVFTLISSLLVLYKI